jgi:hypothetical protein
MKETEGFPPHFFTIHYYLLLSFSFKNTDGTHSVGIFFFT